jgi:hypothetical protein
MYKKYMEGKKEEDKMIMGEEDACAMNHELVVRILEEMEEAIDEEASLDCSVYCKSSI